MYLGSGIILFLIRMYLGSGIILFLIRMYLGSGIILFLIRNRPFDRGRPCYTSQIYSNTF